MSLFDFGKKQRLYATSYLKTTGKEAFGIEEYNKSKRLTLFIILFNIVIFTILYFSWDKILEKTIVFFIIMLIFSWIGLYFNLKHQKKLSYLLNKD